MQKQKKNLKIYSKKFGKNKNVIFYEKKFKFYSKKFGKKLQLRFRTMFKNKHSILDQTLNNIKKNLPRVKINIRLTQNNIFCTLTKIKTNQTLLISSAGIEHIKTSKKLLKFSAKNILPFFFEKISKNIKQKKILLNLKCPKRLKKKLILQINTMLIKNIYIINTKNNKCFNGCKAKKKKRKKYKKWRIFK